MTTTASCSTTGVDVTANQDETSDHETFQLEWDASTGRWYIRTMGDRYWTLEASGGVQASAPVKTSNALFTLDYQVTLVCGRLPFCLVFCFVVQHDRRSSLSNVRW